MCLIILRMNISSIGGTHFLLDGLLYMSINSAWKGQDFFYIQFCKILKPFYGYMVERSSHYICSHRDWTNVLYAIGQNICRVPQPNKDSSAGRFTEFLPRSSRVPPPELQSSAHRLPEFRPPLVSPIGPVPPLLVSHQNKCSADTGWGETGH